MYSQQLVIAFILGAFRLTKDSGQNVIYSISRNLFNIITPKTPEEKTLRAGIKSKLDREKIVDLAKIAANALVQRASNAKYSGKKGVYLNRVLSTAKKAPEIGYFAQDAVAPLKYGLPYRENISFMPGGGITFETAFGRHVDRTTHKLCRIGHKLQFG